MTGFGKFGGKFFSDFRILTIAYYRATIASDISWAIDIVLIGISALSVGDMPPGPKRRLPKGDGGDDTSDVVSGASVKPPVAAKLVRHSDSESDAPLEKQRRVKPASPKVRRAARLPSVEMSVSEVESVLEPVAPKEKVASRPVTTDAGATSGGQKVGRRAGVGPKSVVADPVVAMKRITGSLMEVVLADSVDRSVARLVTGIAADYEVLLMGLVAENERLKGRLEAGGGGVVAGAASEPRRVAVAAGPAVMPAAARRSAFPSLPKPVETWSVVVKGKGKATAKEVVEKVVKEVGPTLGVRVHDVRPMGAGGAVIRTPSVAERGKVATNAKFAEVGLEVSVNDKLGPRVTVQRVHRQITPDEFMAELYELNLKGRMTAERYRKAVRLVSAPWTAGEGETAVVLECTKEVAEQLRATGVYIKWFRFIVRMQDAVATCYRCLSFDHRVRDCRMAESVCRRCGQTGHEVSRCVNALRCRNCDFRGLPADHMMMSDACPIYAARVARANARH